ncbi:MAG TPA: GNAT family N-acetyltransferase [Herpetosiphonaceae bacterium]
MTTPAAASGPASEAPVAPAAAKPEIDIEHRFSMNDGLGAPIAHVEVHHRNGALFLTNVWVHPDHRRQGHARRLIATALRMFARSTLYLNVNGYTNRPLSDDRLTQFYASFGFELIPGAPGMMCRKPAK